MGDDITLSLSLVNCQNIPQSLVNKLMHMFYLSYN